MELGNDLRYAWRQLRRSPGFALAAMLTLALGIGATTTMFSIVDQVLLRPLPYTHPEQIVAITQAPPDKDAAASSGGISEPDVQGWQTRSHTLQAVSDYTVDFPVVSGIDHPHSTVQFLVSTNFLRMFGVHPSLGRDFLASESNGAASHVLVLGAEAWHSLFNSDPHVLGRSLSLSGRTYTIVGVLPESFRFQGGSYLLFSPLDETTAGLIDRSSGSFNVLGRLQPNASLADAARELNGIRQQDQKTYGDKESGEIIHVESYAATLTRSVRPALLLLNGLVLAVWLLATVNVAGLLLTRTQGRRREIAVRAALGAGSARLLRQFLVESLMLSLMGGAVGLAITGLALRVMHHYLANMVTNGDLVHVDPTVCLYVLAASCASALLFGMLPALQAARQPILRGLREGSAGSGTSRRQSAARDALIAVEIALSLLLLAAAGVMVHTLYDMQHQPLGFDPENVVTAELMLPQKGLWFASQPTNGPKVTQTFIDPMLARIRQLPGVTDVGVTTVRPLRTNFSFLDRIEFAGRPKPDPRYQQSANTRAATPDYFRAMGIPLVQGRFFNDQDSPAGPVATVVNEAFVRQIVVTGSPLGMQVKDEDQGPHKYATIVGVMADVRQGMSDTVKPEMLFNLDQILPTDQFYGLLTFHLDLIVRAHANADALLPAVTRIIHDLNPDVGVNSPESMKTTVADTMGSQTLAARLLSLFALAALVIAAAGLYGLLAYQVAQQTRDFGVRLALGAQSKDLLWLVMRRAVTLLAVGSALGIAASLGVTRLAASLMAGVDLHNILLVIEAVTAILAITCITASYLPARRAAHTDPIEALRHE